MVGGHPVPPRCFGKIFLTAAEAFKDSVISCVNRILGIRYCRDLGTACERVVQTMSQECENIFSLIGRTAKFKVRS